MRPLAPAQAETPFALVSSAAGTVYDGLRQRIVALEYPPGTSLVRSELAREYGVSLTPLREAMQLLEQDGLVRIVPQSGTLVRPIDVAQLHETQFLRVSVETEVVRVLARDPGAPAAEGPLAEAGEIWHRQAALLGDTDQYGLFNQLDRAFHRALFAGVGMAGLHAMLSRRLGHLARCQRLDLPSEGKMQAILDAHRAILDAVLARDAETAAAAMRRHLSGTISRVEHLRALHPAYFSDPP